MGRGELEKRVVLDITRGGDDDVARRVDLAKKTHQVVALEASHGLGCAQNRAAQRVVRPEKLDDRKCRAQA